MCISTKNLSFPFKILNKAGFFFSLLIYFLILLLSKFFPSVLALGFLFFFFFHFLRGTLRLLIWNLYLIVELSAVNSSLALYKFWYIWFSVSPNIFWFSLLILTCKLILRYMKISQISYRQCSLCIFKKWWWYFSNIGTECFTAVKFYWYSDIS